jgi:hypothetical protein
MEVESKTLLYYPNFNPNPAHFECFKNLFSGSDGSFSQSPCSFLHFGRYVFFVVVSFCIILYHRVSLHNLITFLFTTAKGSRSIAINIPLFFSGAREAEKGLERGMTGINPDWHSEMFQCAKGDMSVI